MKTYELKSFAKINLALHVTGKLTNLHKIESVIKFIDLHDKISINEINILSMFTEGYHNLIMNYR